MKITFTKKEWDCLDFVSVYTNLLPPEESCKQGGKHIVDLSHEDWDELNGFIANEANHAESRRTEKQFDAVYDKIESIISADFF